MKKTTILAALAAAALSTSALAADISTKAPRYVAPPEATNWTGAYAGLNFGYGRGSDGSSIDGVLGGGQVGYNWQLGSVVFGVEADGQATGQRGSITAPFGVTVTRDLPWLATARGRVGYAFNSILLYGTGGAAFTNYDVTASFGGQSVNSSVDFTAWTAGGGAEWMFAPRWSVKAEYLHVDSGERTVALFGTAVTGKLRDDILRAGVNYHF